MHSTRGVRACLLTVAAVCVAIGAAWAEPDAREILRRVQTYLAQWEESLAAVVAEEHYTQIFQTSARIVGR